MQKEWLHIARRGYCTMNPMVGRWLTERSGQEVGPTTRMHTLSLDAMLRLVLPEKVGIIAKKHDAGADAEMARLIYLALLSCRKHGE